MFTIVLGMFFTKRTLLLSVGHKIEIKIRLRNYTTVLRNVLHKVRKHTCYSLEYL